MQVPMVWLPLVVLLLPAVSTLECYVCDNQDGNTEKCTKTIKTCEYEEDRCEGGEVLILSKVVINISFNWKAFEIKVLKYKVSKHFSICTKVIFEE